MSFVMLDKSIDWNAPLPRQASCFRCFLLQCWETSVMVRTVYERFNTRMKQNGMTFTLFVIAKPRCEFLQSRLQVPIFI
ncbi:hypothetical protein J6590_033644 [Homalodisca vitripennis]|nr:hypothetical protein J6590_033644 [Homalodisca vitripennis]